MNICTVYEIVEVDDARYIAMEVVDGKPFSDFIGKTALPVQSVLRYGTQIASLGAPLQSLLGAPPATAGPRRPCC